MNSISKQSMKSYLNQFAGSQFNLTKYELRDYLVKLNFGKSFIQSGWLIRLLENHPFLSSNFMLFAEIIYSNKNYSEERNFEEPPRRLHTICSTMHQIGIHSYFCIPVIEEDNNAESVKWFSTQLGIPEDDSYHDLIGSRNNFIERSKNYNFLRYKTDATQIPEEHIAEEFTKENLRVSFQNNFMSEMADIDGVFWGEQFTYPMEIKEKTCANDSRLGDYFGIDVGPFVKLDFYAAKKGNLHSIFIVKEIDNPEDRNLLTWWFITFETLAQYASWVPRRGGTSMGGGPSMVIMVPKHEFKELNQENLNKL